MTRALAAVMSTAGLVVAVSAQAPGTPTVGQILDRYVQAVGGKAALDKVATRVMVGTFENFANDQIPLEVYAKAPDKRVEIHGPGDASRGFNGESGWSLNVTENGFRALSGTALARAKREAAFNGEFKLDQIYAQLVTAGTGKVGGRDAYLVQASVAEGGTEKLYFDAQSGLLVRRDVMSEITLDGNSQVQVAVQIDFDDYRDVDGIKLPFTIRRTFPRGARMSTTFRAIRHNLPIDDAKFKVPGP